jgi:uroporphyrinogen-III synthase
MKPRPDAQLAAWCEALASASRARQPDVVPPGWFTVRQLMYAMKAGKKATAQKVAALLRAGRAEVREFAVSVGASTRAVRHYRLK